jgi:hypothetical protein
LKADVCCAAAIAGYPSIATMVTRPVTTHTHPFLAVAPRGPTQSGTPSPTEPECTATAASVLIGAIVPVFTLDWRGRVPRNDAAPP